MIMFYPRDVGMWRTGEFDFSDRNKSVITLDVKQKNHYKKFHDRVELIEFLKEHGVRLDDAEYPLKFVKLDNPHVRLDVTHSVQQWTLIGWIKDDLC